MRGRDSSGFDPAPGRTMDELHSTGSERKCKYRVAMALYAVLALLVWFTMDAGKVIVFGRPVELRLVPLIIIGSLALRTIIAGRADKIRRGDGNGG